jgi:hypothetical protein
VLYANNYITSVLHWNFTIWYFENIRKPYLETTCIYTLCPNLKTCNNEIIFIWIMGCENPDKSFCFWWWNRNDKQKYNTDINICTNKSGPFIHETEHARYMQSSTVSVWKNCPSLLCLLYTHVVEQRETLSYNIGSCWRFPCLNQGLLWLLKSRSQKGSISLSLL